MLQVLQFWVDQGVDGFRVDAVIYLVEDKDFHDEAPSGANVPSNNYDYLYHNYTQGLQETYDVVASWTKFFREYGAKNNKHIFSYVTANFLCCQYLTDFFAGAQKDTVT